MGLCRWATSENSKQRAVKGSSEIPEYLQISSPLATVTHRVHMLGRRAVEDGHTQVFLPTVASAGFWPVLSGRVRHSAWYQQKATGGSWGGYFCLLERDIRRRNCTLIFVSEDRAARGKTASAVLPRPLAAEERSKEQCSILRHWWAETERERDVNVVGVRYYHTEPLMIIKHKSINRLLCRHVYLRRGVLEQKAIKWDFISFYWISTHYMNEARRWRGLFWWHGNWVKLIYCNYPCSITSACAAGKLINMRKLLLSDFVYPLLGWESKIYYRIGYLRSGIGYLLSNKIFDSAYRFLCAFFSSSVRTGAI